MKKGTNFMVDKSPDGSSNKLQKKSNPFKKILADVKKFIKKDEEENKKPSSFVAAKNEKKETGKKPTSFEAAKKKKREKNKKSPSFKESKKEKNPELSQQSANSSVLGIEAPEAKEDKTSMQEKKAKIKEQKLPKKYRKGW
jgi:hypothetical protein